MAKIREKTDIGSHAEAAASVKAAGRTSAGADGLEFVIEGMDCADCAQTIEKAVARLPGVQSAGVNFVTARLSVEASEKRPELASIIERTVGEAGYRATPANARGRFEHIPFWKRERRVLTTGVGTVAALFALALSLAGAQPWLVNSLFAVTIAVSGLGFARAGLLAARTGRADMNLLMSIAAVGAVALGDWAEAATVVLLFAFGGTLQAYTLEKTRSAIRALMDLSPTTALVLRPDHGNGSLPVMREMRLPVEEVLPGETVLVGPGERLPLDGVVLSGTSAVDQSPITGESVPVEVETGSEVYAGTINGPGAFSIRVSRATDDTTLAHIIQMVEQAQSRRAPSQQFVDRFSAIYTPLVIAGAVLVAVVPPLLLAQPFAEWFYRALVLLVISCPCALVISTPVSIVAAIGAATGRGVLIKGGATLESLSKVRSIAFDKTGTLTEGRPRVVSVHALDGDTNGLLALAAAVERRSEHPLARAVVHAARPSHNGSGGHEAANFTALPGWGAQADVNGRTVYVGNARLFAERGIPFEAVALELDALYERGNTAVLIGDSRGVSGVIGLADSPRPDAKQAVERLRRAGIAHIAMLTGDNEQTAASIARQVGVDDYYAALLPAGKVEAVRRMADEYGSVAMVGDGVNDAPALAASDVGIAMGVAGTDAALEVADVALMSDDLSRLDYAVLLSCETVRVIKQNIVASLGVKALALALASLGTLPLWAAILADMGVSLLVTLNGMRLLGYKGRKGR